MNKIPNKIMDAENTPRTDAALLRYSGGEPVTFRGITLVVDADFARQLERELREVQQKNVAWALGIEQSNTDIVDMQRDEFRRIIAITDNQEIKGICERAIAVIEQTVPVVVQRDNAENERDELRRQNERLREALITIHRVLTKDGVCFHCDAGDDVICAEAFDSVKQALAAQTEKTK